MIPPTRSGLRSGACWSLTPRPEVAPLSLRVSFSQEFLLLEAAELELAARYGDFAGNPLTGDSLNQIGIARARLIQPTPARARN